MFQKIKEGYSFFFRKQKERNRISRYIFSYLSVILICTVVMTTLVYNYMTGKTEDNVINANNATLLNFRNTIDSFVLKNIDNISLTVLSENDIFVGLFSKPLESNIPTVIELHDKLKNLASFNPIITEISLYYKNNSMVISTKGIRYLTDNSVNPSDHRDVDWIPYMDSMKSFYEWMETRKTRGKETDINYSVNTITLLRKYPFSYNEYLGGLAISIDESKLKTLIKNTAPENMQQIIIVNESGIIISHNDESLISTSLSDLPYGRKLLNSEEDNGYFVTWHNGKKMVVSYTVSGYNKWKYVSVNYIDQLSEGYRFLNLVLIYFILSIIITCIFALLLSVKRIATANSEVKDLSSIVKEQESELQKNRNIVRQNFYLNLINGIYQKTEEVKNQLQFLKIDYSYPFYIVAVIKLYGENTTDLRTFEYTKLKIIEYADILFENMDINCLCTQSNKNIILILNIPKEELDYKEIIRKICGYIFNTLGFQTCTGMGDICNDLTGIAVSYRQALKCINYGYLFQDKRILAYNEVIPLESSKNVISKGYIEGFSSHLFLRNKKEALLCIHDLVADISQGIYSFNRTMAALRQIITELENFRKRLFKDSEDNKYSDLYYDFNCCENITDFIVLIENVLDAWLIDEESSSNARNKELVDKVKLYISSNITHEVISLNTVADVMHISPNYLSRIFKEETGMYFIDYLIEVKLEMSKDLLLCSDMSIESIAEAAGYSSSLYYNRKFKARYGRTPKQYREENME